MYRGRGVLLTDQPLLELVGVTGGDRADISRVAKELQQISLRVASYQLRVNAFPACIHSFLLVGSDLSVESNFLSVDGSVEFDSPVTTRRTIAASTRGAAADQTLSPLYGSVFVARAITAKEP